MRLVVSHSTSGREKKGKKERTGKDLWFYVEGFVGHSEYRCLSCCSHVSACIASNKQLSNLKHRRDEIWNAVYNLVDAKTWLAMLHSWP